MNYSQAIDYLYHSLPMYSRTGSKAIKLDLHKTHQLCAWLGHPERKIKTIHIAGTNGKGSVSSMLAAIFQEHGYRTGLYTSPHLRDFRERIRINGKMISKKHVVDFTEKSKKFSEEIQPSFFELTFAMALDYFATQHVDVAMIETGLGGRLDSTNVIIPNLSVITNIGWDHMDILGGTLEKIAVEKAGIIKENVPVVIGETQRETKDVFISIAKQKHAPIFFADENFRVQKVDKGSEKISVPVQEISSGTTQIFSPDLTGRYQQKNLLTVLQSVKVLQQSFGLKSALVNKALMHVRSLTGFEGRWQIINKKPLTVLDVAHNVDGVKEVLSQLAAAHYRRLHLITGMVKDKDLHGVLNILPSEATYYFTNAHIPRALPAEELKNRAAQYGLSGEAYDDVNDALAAARQQACPDDMILVCGSVFVVGELKYE